MPQIEFVGGPFDGLKLTSGLGDPFLWTDGRRCYRAPRRSLRALYRLAGEPLLSVAASRYRFVGHTHGLCRCGVYRKRRRPCDMCGATEMLA